MKRLSFLFIYVFSSLLMFGQNSLSLAKQREVIAKIDKSVAAMHTMQCQFRQSKTMKIMKRSITSNGVMYFEKPNKLRWQYVSPYSYTLIFNGNKAYMKSAKSTTTVDVNKNKMFKQIIDVVVNCVTGGNLSNNEYFKVAVCQSGKSFYANLTPQKKEMKQVYSLITLYFNTSLTMVNKVVMKEKNGDTTTIDLSEIKTNVNVDDKVFSNR